MRKTFAPVRPDENLTAPQHKTRGSVLPVIAAVLLLLALCACGGDPAPTPEPTPSQVRETPLIIWTSPKETPSAEETPLPGETPPAYDTVRAGCLTVVTCTDFPPYSYSKNGGPAGIDPELAAALAERLGLSLEIYETDYAALEKEVAEGRADLALAGLVPGKTDKNLIYTVGYHVNRQLILALRGRADALGTEGLAGCRIGVFAGSQGELRLSWDLEDRGKAVLSRFDTESDALSALGADEVDCLVLDASLARILTETNSRIEILPRSYLSERYAGLMREDNTELYKAVNDAIRALVHGGGTEEIAARYLPGG